MYETLTKHSVTHSSKNTADKGLRNTNNDGYIQRINGQDGKGEFSFEISIISPVHVS